MHPFQRLRTIHLFKQRELCQQRFEIRARQPPFDASYTAGKLQASRMLRRRQQKPLEPPDQQLGLPIEMAPDPLRKELEEIEPDSLSPLEALQKLYELRSRLSQ